MARNSDGLSLALGGIVGAVIYIVGFILTVIFVESGISETLSLMTALFGLFGGSALDGYVISHLLIHDLGMTDGEFAARLVPFTLVMVLLLFVGGALTAAISGGGAKAGASITVGFGLMVSLSLLYLLASLGGDAAPITMGIFVGVIYPAVFGGIGGALIG